MDQDPLVAAPPADNLDDTLGGIEGSPGVPSGHSNGAHHQQSHSFDQILTNSAFESPDQILTNNAQPPEDIDPNAQYDVAAVPQQPHSTSRPPSGLSGAGDRPAGYNDHASRGSNGAAEQSNGRNHVVIKVGMVGDAQIGKTSLMVKYVEGSWDEDYIQTLGVNFMEKTISIRNTEITFSIWDLGGQREFVNMLPLVCNDAVAILYMFDLTRKSTLNSIKEWYRQGRGFNKTAIPILVGTKYDHFVNFPREDQEEISNQVG